MNRYFVVLPCFLFFAAACTFNYEDVQSYDKKQPDMLFSRVAFRRYEDAQLDVIAHIESLEMYDDEKIWAGSTVTFTQYAKDSADPKESMTGKAGLIFIEEETATYYLGDTVVFHLIEDDYKVDSSALLLKKNENLLTAPQDALVTIRHGEDTKVSGKNFVANTQTKEYLFKKDTTGFITISDENDELDDKNDSENKF